MADKESAPLGYEAIYEYVLREWWEGWDAPAAENTTRSILAALDDAGLVIRSQEDPIG